MRMYSTQEVRLHLTVGIGSESDYLAGESNVSHHLFTVEFSSESDYLARECKNCLAGCTVNIIRRNHDF